MPESPVDRHLTLIGKIRGTGSNVAETSFYPALAELLNDVGKGLSPKVLCVIHISDKGAGLTRPGFLGDWVM